MESRSLYARTSRLLRNLARRLTAISPANDLDSGSVYLHQSAAASRESGLRDGAGGSIHNGFAFALKPREAILLAIPLRSLSYPRPANRVLTKHTAVHWFAREEPGMLPKSDARAVLTLRASFRFLPRISYLTSRSRRYNTFAFRGSSLLTTIQKLTLVPKPFSCLIFATNLDTTALLLLASEFHFPISTRADTLYHGCQRHKWP